MATKKKTFRKIRISTKKQLVSKKKKASKLVAAYAKAPALKYANYPVLEAELKRLTDLLNFAKKKSVLVRRSLTYLEREQKHVLKQIHDAKRFLHQLKNRGLAAIRNFPENAEDLYYQLKGEFNRISKRLRS